MSVDGSNQADFEAMGIGAISALLPQLVVGGAQVGTLTDSAAHALGLTAGTCPSITLPATPAR